MIAEGLKELVPVPEDTNDPAQVVRSIRKSLDSARAAEHSDERLMQISMSVGALWGEQVCRDMGWEWVRLSYESGFEGYAVAAPNRSVVCVPVQYVRRILSSRRQTTQRPCCSTCFGRASG